MYQLSRQQRLFCSRCTICQDSSWYDAEDVLAVKTASAILLKIYQLSRPQLICCWRCTSCQGSSCHPTEDAPAAKTARKTAATSYSAGELSRQLYQLTRQKLLVCWRYTSCQDRSCYFCRRCTSWHAPAFFVKLKLNPWVARCTLSLSKCTLVLPPNSIAQGNWLPVHIVEMVYYHTPRIWWTIPPKRKKPATTLRKRIVFDFFYIITPVSYLPSIS